MSGPKYRFGLVLGMGCWRRIFEKYERKTLQVTALRIFTGGACYCCTKTIDYASGSCYKPFLPGRKLTEARD